MNARLCELPLEIMHHFWKSLILFPESLYHQFCDVLLVGFVFNSIKVMRFGHPAKKGVNRVDPFIAHIIFP